MFRLCLLTAAVACTGLPASARPAAKTPDPLKWKVLLVIKKKTVVLGGVQASMTEADEQAIRNAFTDSAPKWISKLSGGKIAWETTVVVSKTPLTTISGQDEKRPGDYWPTAEDVRSDVTEHVTPGQFDSVVVYWKGVDDRDATKRPKNFGMTYGPIPEALGCGFSTVPWDEASKWTEGSESTEVFVHEWAHQLEQFFKGRAGLRVPELDGAGTTPDRSGKPYAKAALDPAKPELAFWKVWYADYLRGEIPDPAGGTRGLGEPAWKWSREYGTIREQARPMVNLLRNGTFEGDERTLGDQWDGHAVFDGGLDVKLADDRRHGKKSLHLKLTETNVVALTQAVTLRPNHTYLLGGWVKASKLTGGGVTLSAADEGPNGVSEIPGSRTPATHGTKDWTFVKAVFDCGIRTDAAVVVRVGQTELAAGEVWLDDLWLIDLGKKQLDLADQVK